MVPFRLTQNLVDGFGVSGFEGVFRRVAEITLQACQLSLPLLFFLGGQPGWRLACAAVPDGGVEGL